jgi:hypothetical protein
MAAPHGATAPPRAPLGAPSAAWVEREGARGIGAAERLRAYRTFLDGARALKASHGSSALFESDVVAQARRAQEDLRALGGSSLRLTRHLEATGLLGDAFAAIRQALARGGPVSVHDLFMDVVEDSTGRQALGDLGLSEATVKAMGEAIRAADVTARADDAGVRVTSARLDRDVRLMPRPRREPPESPGDLLFGRLFDAAVAGWETPGPFPFDVSELPRARGGEPVVRDPLDAMLAASVAARLEMARHVRGLEDGGLATHAGRDPATAGFAALVFASIASTVAIIGATIKVTCAVSQQLGPGDFFCQIGDILLGLALILFAAAAVLAIISIVLQTAGSASSG